MGEKYHVTGFPDSSNPKNTPVSTESDRFDSVLEYNHDNGLAVYRLTDVQSIMMRA